MIVNRGETKSIKVSNGTIDGVRFNIYLYASTVNVPIVVATDFAAQQISVKVELKRDKQVMLILQDNLSVLGLFSAKNYGLTQWIKGSVFTAEGGSVKGAQMLSLQLNFGGVINVMDDDELTVQVVVGASTFAAALDQAVSYVEFNENFAIGVERGTPQVTTQVVQANISQERYSFGDGVAKVMFLQFDKTTMLSASQVINTCQLSSDKLQEAYNFPDLLTRDRNYFVSPITRYNSDLAAGVDYPQTMILYAFRAGRWDLLNNVFVSCSYNTTNVNASQNYWCAQRFILSKLVAERAAKKIVKHVEENMQHV